MTDATWTGVLTLRGEGADPRVVHHIEVEDRLAEKPHQVAEFYRNLMESDGTVYFRLAEDENGPDSFLIVRTERIESIVISPEETHDT